MAEMEDYVPFICSVLGSVKYGDIQSPKRAGSAGLFQNGEKKYFRENSMGQCYFHA